MSSLSGSGAAARPSCVVWGPSLLAYDFGESHPMNPARLDLTARLAKELGLFELPGLSVLEPFEANDAQLLSVHSREYVEAVRRVSETPGRSDELRGLGTEDVPAFVGIHEASARLVGASLAAAEAIISGRASHAVNFAGGMHHASRDRASGFCVYNDAAAAIRRLLDGGADRVLYVDIDAHHGDGTEHIFRAEPRVMTISLHETGLMLFPGTGFANEIGEGQAEGTAVNVALPSGTADAAWLRAFHAVVPQLAEAFAPDVIVSQHGCDSHRDDPLSGLQLSVDAQRQAALSIKSLADRHCEGRWLATGGGGYHITGVVPRAWSHLIAIAGGAPVPPDRPVPQPWRDYVRERFGQEAPRLMGDDGEVHWRGWESGYDPGDEVDRTVIATRKAVFPHFGLDPWLD